MDSKTARIDQEQFPRAGFKVELGGILRLESGSRFNLLKNKEN